MESHRFLASDGVGLRYLTGGSSGSWVVLLHGRTESAERMWISTGILDALAEDHRVVALELRNHGETAVSVVSDKPGPGLETRAEDVIGLLDHLGIGRPHIHGYSLGAVHALELLALIPERIITSGRRAASAKSSQVRFSRLRAAATRSRLLGRLSAPGAAVCERGPPSAPPSAAGAGCGSWTAPRARR